MSDVLRWFLLGLVLCNLTFVQVTGAVDAAWMAALWVMSGAAPLLVRWHELLVYRVTWNALVLGAFAFLMQHALTTGLRHMLEDGLLLAALCQVHLLNNVGRRQRPDLLFFNSFLITFVTSFFSSDIGWSLCFCVYAALLVPALQLFVVLPRDREPERRVVTAVLRNSMPRAAAALAITAAVFVLWPRDFRHQGWLGDTLQLSSPQLVAFAEEIRLDRDRTPALDNSPVMRIRPRGGGAEAVPEHWRGVTFVRFDGKGWRPYRARDFHTRRATDEPWHAVSRTEWRRDVEPRGPALDVVLVDTEHERLFTPLSACAVAVPDGDNPVLFDPKADGVLGIDPFTRPDGAMSCTLRLGGSPTPPRLSALAERLLTQLPRQLPGELEGLLAQVRTGLDEDADPHTVAGRSRDWLRANRSYALPGTTGAARNLGEFVLGTGAGHCEYFATTLALLLRLQGIPCRVVGGYVAHEWHADRGELVIRRRHAHAWVEALLPGAGWSTLDATPATAVRGDEDVVGWWSALRSELEELWRAVTTFDEAGRERLFGWLTSAPGRLLRALGRRPLLSTVLGALLGIWLWQRRRRRAEPRVVSALRRAMRRAGVRPARGETPREVLLRARSDERLSAVKARRLQAAVTAHEATRYGR